MKRATIFLSASLALASSAVTAQTVLVMGRGLTHCGDAVSEMARGTAFEAAYGEWVLGYITGRNQSALELNRSAVIGKDHSVTTMLAAFKAKCQQDPLATVLDATSRLYGELASRQSR